MTTLPDIKRDHEEAVEFFSGGVPVHLVDAYCVHEHRATLINLLERAIPYMKHKIGCDMYRDETYDCTCEFDDVMKQLEGK